MIEETEQEVSALQFRFWRALDLMRAAEVPVEDRSEGASPDGPVTLCGMYRVPTKSGRTAWAYFEWRNGVVAEDWCSYDPALRRVCDELVTQGADPFRKHK